MKLMSNKTKNEIGYILIIVCTISSILFGKHLLQPNIDNIFMMTNVVLISFGAGMLI